ncbi:class I SAM-dependent methyltransferase [Terricaulis sp.]|uniref:class I SAM-dependent methyltransferase n=1 Tax=Terricaulis sp. TaxID=2768686 RepID=UPI0037835AC6
MLAVLKTLAKENLVPIIYRYPPSMLAPERLATYLHALLERRHLAGDVAEIGCNLGGTAAIAARMLKRTGWSGTYVCFDTFGGFVAEQFEQDVALGTEAHRADMFAANSKRLVERILAYHEAPEVRLVEGDITKIANAALGGPYAAVLLDIDLSEPTHVALNRFWPLLSPGGAIYVDDCPAGKNWKARVGYARFCAEQGLPERYEYGLGVVERPARDA